MTNTELAKQHGATTYTNRHAPDDPYVAMSVKQLDAYTQAAIAADQGPDLTAAFMAGLERGKDMAAAQAAQTEWKEAMLDGLASICIDAPVTATPREILGQIIRANVDMALSPEVSEETAFRAVQAVPGWQPMDTAPTDGTELLLRSAAGRIANGSYVPVNGRLGYWAWAMVKQEPTHWMPLPTSPKENQT